MEEIQVVYNSKVKIKETNFPSVSNKKENIEN